MNTRSLPLPSPAPAVAGLALWLSVALGIALSGFLTLERRFLVPVMIVGLVGAQVLAYRRGGAFRALADATSTRALVLFHAIRAPIGATFLVLLSYGLDATFARVAGWGDVVSGLGALVVGLFFARSRSLTLTWNLIGLADILAVVVTAQRILVFSDHPQTMQMLVHFPGMLLPTFLVPLVIATHLLLVVRLRAPGREGSA